MRLSFHPDVAADIALVTDYYLSAAGVRVADDFGTELEQAFGRIAEAPNTYSVRGGDICRANLVRFPYHVLFRVTAGSVQVLVVRHYARHPAYGTTRR